mgnify:CR=1 FL=1
MKNPFEKIVYQDVLQEWRNVKIWEFHLFDKVIVQETLGRFQKKDIIWVVIGWGRMDFTDDKITMDYYEVILQNWKKETFCTKVKPYYWEFQEEFEILDEVQKLQKEMEDKGNRIKELLPKMSKIKSINMKELGLQ